MHACLSLVDVSPQADISVRHDLPVIGVDEAVARKCIIPLNRDLDLSILCHVEDVTQEKRSESLPSLGPDVRR